MIRTSLALALAATSTTLLPADDGRDVVVETGTTFVFDTGYGPLHLNSLTIEPGGTMLVRGPNPLNLVASEFVRIEGTLDLSGETNPGVLTLNSANVPEPGAPGQAGGGSGGTGSFETTESTPRGGHGFGSFETIARGGGGGETGYHPSGHDNRRGAGGGGGAFGPDRPESGDPADPINLGLVAEGGADGSPVANGALTDMPPPAGGAIGRRPFQDGDASNDFWGRALVGGAIVSGELATPRAGTGGGAGGDAVWGSSFPTVPFLPTGDEKGAGGGGGGGLGILRTRTLVIAGEGVILANGGAGGGGENTMFFNRIGGGSGGGSGGMLVLEAAAFDLSTAGDRCLQALGGRGGVGADNDHDAVGSGGDGGPGLVQLHTMDGTDGSIQLPAGRTLADLSAPDAHVMLPTDLP